MTGFAVFALLEESLENGNKTHSGTGQYIAPFMHMLYQTFLQNYQIYCINK